MLIGASSTVQFLAGLLVALLIGFEAATIRRWKLTRRGWKMLGFVVGEDAEMAERRFFAEWAKTRQTRARRRRPPRRSRATPRRCGAARRRRPT